MTIVPMSKFIPYSNMVVILMLTFTVGRMAIYPANKRLVNSTGVNRAGIIANDGKQAEEAVAGTVGRFRGIQDSNTARF